MKLATVVGSVWATKKMPSLSGQTLLVVQTESSRIVAADLVGAGAGERVLIATGGAARIHCPGCAVDAAIVAIIDQEECSHVH